MRLSIILPTLLAAIAMATPNPVPQPNGEVRARFYDELQKRYCAGGNGDNICGDGYFYVCRSSSPSFPDTAHSTISNNGHSLMAL